jgi:hypothetical protein
MNTDKPIEVPRAGEERFYRAWAAGQALVPFTVSVAESDLQVFADRALPVEAEHAIRCVRRDIELYASAHHDFLPSLKPVDPWPTAPDPVLRMCKASADYGIGPMAAVAGVVAEHVGRSLLSHTRRVIVENGGDIFFELDRPPVLGLYAGPASPFTGHVRFRPGTMRSGAVCTSSGTVGHSLSFGRADAVVTVASSAAIADAAATAIGNTIRSAQDIQRAIDLEAERGLLEGLIIALDDQLGAWGTVEFVEGV